MVGFVFALASPKFGLSASAQAAPLRSIKDVVVHSMEDEYLSAELTGLHGAPGRSVFHACVESECGKAVEPWSEDESFGIGNFRVASFRCWSAAARLCCVRSVLGGREEISLGDKKSRESCEGVNTSGEYGRDGDSQTEAASQAGSMTMIKRKESMVKHHTMKNNALAQSNLAHVAMTDKIPAQRHGAPVVGTTKTVRNGAARRATRVKKSWRWTVRLAVPTGQNRAGLRTTGKTVERNFFQARDRLSKTQKYTGAALMRTPGWTFPWRKKHKKEKWNGADTREDERRQADEQRVIPEAMYNFLIEEV